MKFLLITLLLVAAIISASCKGSDTSSTNQNAAPAQSKPTSAATAAAPAPAESRPASPSAQTPAPAQPTLIGTYQLVEVQKQGAVRMMSELKTEIHFQADGSYARIAKRNGKQYHSDSGSFRIVPPDQLVLSVQLSDKNIQQPAFEKKQKFSLSPDGDELTLTSAEGSVAKFKRTVKPQPAKPPGK